MRSECTLCTFATKRNDPRPRPGPGPSTSLCDAPRWALRLASDTAPRCLGYRFYNQRSRHEHSMSTPPLETARRTQWVNPPAFDFEAGPGREVLPPSVQVPAPDHLAVIRPPAAARLTARPPASARSTTALDACASSRRRAPALFRLPDAPSIGFLWRPFRRPFPRPTSGLVPETPDPGSLRARQCQAAILRDPDAFHRMGSDRALSREPSRRAAPAGRPEQSLRVFTGVRRHRLDLPSRRFRGANRGRALPCEFCRWMSPRARPRTTRTS